MVRNPYLDNLLRWQDEMLMRIGVADPEVQERVERRRLADAIRRRAAAERRLAEAAEREAALVIDGRDATGTDLCPGGTLTKAEPNGAAFSPRGPRDPVMRLIWEEAEQRADRPTGNQMLAWLRDHWRTHKKPTGYVEPNADAIRQMLRRHWRR